MSRLPGMRGPSFRRPRCSVGHTTPARRGANGQWFCPDCLNEHVHRQRKQDGDARSKAGVVLPAGVKLEVPDYVSDIFPNRRARRRALKR